MNKEAIDFIFYKLNKYDISEDDGKLLLNTGSYWRELELNVSKGDRTYDEYYSHLTSTLRSRDYQSVINALNESSLAINIKTPIIQFLRTCSINATMSELCVNVQKLLDEKNNESNDGDERNILSGIEDLQSRMGDLETKMTNLENNMDNLENKIGNVDFELEKVNSNLEESNTNINSVDKITNIINDKFDMMIVYVNDLSQK
jgi:chromosome segregation ATPase